MVKLKHDKDDLIAVRTGRYLVCHASKFSATAVKGLERHIQRNMKSSINEDIDTAKTSLNYDLSGFDKNTMNYSTEIKKRLDERFTGSKMRKDAVVMVGFVISASPEVFEGLSDEQEKAYFKTAFDYIASEFGRENIISATVHKDEKTPHLHINFVPLTADGRLCAKELINRERLLNIQENLPKSLQEKGFDIQRGLPSRKTRNKHKSPRQWKIENAKDEFTRKIKRTEQRIGRAELRKRITSEYGTTLGSGIKTGEVLNARTQRNYQGSGSDSGRKSLSEDRVYDGSVLNGDIVRETPTNPDRLSTKQIMSQKFAKEYAKTEVKLKETSKSKSRSTGGMKV